MQIKSIVAAAAITLIAGVGSVSAAELYVAETKGDAGTQFAVLHEIATIKLSVQEMAATRGLASEWGTTTNTSLLVGALSVEGESVELPVPMPPGLSSNLFVTYRP